MIDARKIKAFWESRAATYEALPFESVANLEQDPENLRLKIEAETAKVFGWLPALQGRSVLYLGAGVGQWALRFAERGAQRVLAVEYAAPLAEIGRKEAAARGASAVEFFIAPAEEFSSAERFDVVFISGLFVYLTDEQAERLIGNLRDYARGALVMVRDGTAVGQRYEIDDRHSDHLGVPYSATYRTREQYRSLLERAGLRLVRDENMFPEGHPLNKYPETRLRLFLFEGTA